MQELWVIPADDAHDRKPDRERVSDDVLRGRSAGAVFDELYAAGELLGRKLDVMWIFALDQPVTRIAFRWYIPPDLRMPREDVLITNQIGRMTADTKVFRWS